jgi:hypothetical protein
MDHMRFNLARSWPARQPEAVSACFKSHSNAGDLAACLGCFIAPTV